MNKKENIYVKKFVRYIVRTAKNKICALALLVLGIISAHVSGDATFLIFAMLFSIPLFFATKNHIN